MQKKIKNNGAFFVLLGAFCFSGSGTIQALAPQEATPFVLGAIRLLVGGLFLFFWCLLNNILQFPKNWLWKNVLFSSFALCAFQMTFFLGVKEAGVAVGTIISIGMTPITAAIFGYLFYKEKPQKSWYISTLIAICGLVLLNLHGVHKPSLLGICLPILAGTIYAYYLSQSRELVKENRSELVMMILFLISSLFMLPIFFIYPFSWVFSQNGILVALGLGIITTGTAYSLVMAGLKTCETAKAATLSLGEPLGAALLGVFLLNEPINIFTIIGICALFSSVLILVYFPDKK